MGAWKLLIIAVMVLMCPICSADTQPENSLILPAPRFDSDCSVETALNERRSIREFSDKPLLLKDLSQMLWAAYGITKPVENGPAFLRGGFRTAPSAGGLYPLEIYVVVERVENLTPGIYRYNSREHTLEKRKSGSFSKLLSKAGLGQGMIRAAPAVVVYSAVFSRTGKKYGERGRERYVWMDAGHSAQNMYLQARSLNMGMCVSGAFSDPEVKTLLGMTREETPLYIIPMGYGK